MPDLGLPMNDAMAQACAEGRKTVTRRPMSPQPGRVRSAGVVIGSGRWTDGHGRNLPARIPGAGIATVGQRVWVRECWAQVLAVDVPSSRYRLMAGTLGIPSRPDWPPCVVYRADGPMPPVQWHHLGDQQDVRWSPSIHMPKWAARTWGRIVSVTPERLQDITENDAQREGVAYREAGVNPRNGMSRAGWSWRSPHPIDALGAAPGWEHCLGTARHAFGNLWNAAYGARQGLSWGDNPWVWRIEWERIERPRPD